MTFLLFSCGASTGAAALLGASAARAKDRKSPPGKNSQVTFALHNFKKTLAKNIVLMRRAESFGSVCTQVFLKKSSLNHKNKGNPPSKKSKQQKK